VWEWHRDSAVQFGFDPVAGQLISSFPTLDFKSQELEAMRDVNDPGSRAPSARISAPMMAPP
jgi:hypothetical protein